MNNALTFEWALGIVMSLVIAAMWRFISSTSSRFEALEKDLKETNRYLNEVKLGYIQKVEFKEEVNKINEALWRVENKIEKLNEKISRNIQ